MSSITLHLGAHRTATTSLQHQLALKAEELGARGIKCLLPPRPGHRDSPTIRDVLRSARNANRSSGPFARATKAIKLRQLRGEFDRLEAAQPGGVARRLIVSEEMLLGPAFDRDGVAIYPSLERGLAPFLAICDGRVDRAHITIRNYSTFIVSVYAMRAVYSGPIAPFETISGNLCHLARGWPTVIAELQRLSKVDEIRVSLFESSTIAGRAGELTESPELFKDCVNAQAANVAPSETAVLYAINHGSRISNPDAFVYKYASGPKFDPLTPQQKACLDARYRDDVDAISRMPGVRLSSPN